MNEQIIIVGTGYHRALTDYTASARYAADRPAYIIDKEGVLQHGGGVGQVVAIENYGAVKEVEGKWYPTAIGSDGRLVALVDEKPTEGYPFEFCTCKPYRGHIYYDYITMRQLETLRQVLVGWLSTLHIRFPWDNQLGEVCPRAVAGRSGIYFASSLDKNRTDIHPQPELINLIKSLAS